MAKLDTAMNTLNFTPNKTNQSRMLVLNKEPLMHHVGNFVDKCMHANHPSTRVLTVAPDDDKRKSAIRVSSIDQQDDCLRTFAARVLASTSVPFGYCPHNAVKSSNGMIDVSRTVHRWNSLFGLLHAELGLPLSNNVAKFVPPFKRINSRRKNRPHPFHRAWDSLERIKNIFHSVCTLLMDNYCVWRRKATSQRRCIEKMTEYGLMAMVGQFPETSVRIISVIWDTIVMLRWVIHMVKNVRIDRCPKDFDPKSIPARSIQKTSEMLSMDIDVTRDQAEWLTAFKTDEVTYYRWCEYSIAFCSEMGDDQMTLKFLPFYQRNVYLGTMLQSLRPYFYTWLQKNQIHDDHLSQVCRCTAVMVKNYHKLPRALPNNAITSTLKSLFMHPLVTQWINHSVPLNPFMVAPPSTWIRMRQLLDVCDPNHIYTDETPYEWMVIYGRLSKLCLLLSNMEQQFLSIEPIEH